MAIPLLALLGGAGLGLGVEAYNRNSRRTRQTKMLEGLTGLTNNQRTILENQIGTKAFGTGIQNILNADILTADQKIDNQLAADQFEEQKRATGVTEDLNERKFSLQQDQYELAQKQFNEQIRYNNAQIAQNASSLYQQMVKNGDMIGDDRSRELQQFFDIQEKFNQFSDVIKNKSGPAAVAATVLFVKNLDPTSVVRQEEGRAVIESSGLPQTIVGKLNQLLGKGGMFPQPVRQELANIVGDLYNRALMNAQQKEAAIDARIQASQVVPALATGGLPRVPQSFDRITVPGGGPRKTDQPDLSNIPTIDEVLKQKGLD